jgi:hypothetical protein
MRAKSIASLLFDIILTLAFFAFMFTVLRPHVPSNNPKMTAFFGASGSACLSGVFWLCVQMFRVVYQVQKAGPSKE